MQYEIRDGWIVAKRVSGRRHQFVKPVLCLLMGVSGLYIR